MLYSLLTELTFQALVISPEATQNWRHWKAVCVKHLAQIRRKQASACGGRAAHS
ncbi:MAG TPA: hypothetical protein V6D14_32830 [Coleofasciculaceae cyanobacterium]